MKVLLLGATGRTGKHVLTALLHAGHQVNLIVRDAAKLNGTTANIFEGDVKDLSIMKNAMQGCDALISVLNISRNSDFPWAKLRTPEYFLSDTMKIILEAAKQTGLKRIIICSAWGVHETKKDIPFWFRWIIDHSNVGVAYRDHERQEDLLAASGLNYTIVRPVGLTNSLKEKKINITENNKPKPSLTISRKSVAGLMAALLNEGQYSKKAITVSNG